MQSNNSKYSRQTENDGTITKSKSNENPCSYETNSLNVPSRTQGGDVGTIIPRESTPSSSDIDGSQASPSSVPVKLPLMYSVDGSADATRSVASGSIESSIIPPPPPSATLRRSDYLPTAPGAERCLGLSGPDDGSIIIGDGQSVVVTNPPNMLSARRIDASYRSQEHITAPVHRVTVRDHDATSSPAHRMGNVHHLPVVHINATAEQIQDDDDEGDESGPFWKDSKVMCSILFLLVLAIGLGVAFANRLTSPTSIESSTLANSTDPSPLSNSTDSPLSTTPSTNSPTQLPMTPAPSVLPTLEYVTTWPIDSARCGNIGKGMAVSNQESLIVKMFSLDLDITVDSSNMDQIPTIAWFLENEIKINMLQQEIAPEIAHCQFKARRRRNLTLLDQFVVGNAIFESVALRTNDVGCSPTVTTETCFTVLVILVVYLEEDLPDSSLIAHILAVFAERSWEFTSPLKGMALTGARSYSIEDVQGPPPTSAPSHEEEEYDYYVKGPTSAPSKEEED